MNTETDSELSLILNQYGLCDLRGTSGVLLQRLATGQLPLLVQNEDYSNSLPQLAYDPIQAEQVKAEQAFREKQKEKAKKEQQGESGPPRSFNPEGYIPPSDDPGPTVPVPRHMLLKPDQLHLQVLQLVRPTGRGNLRVHLLLQECRVRKGNLSKPRKAIDNLTKGNHIRHPFIQTRARREEAKVSPPKDMTKANSRHTKARVMDITILEDGNGIIVGLRLCYFLEENT